MRLQTSLSRRHFVSGALAIPAAAGGTAGKPLTVPAKPRAIELNTAHTAVIVVDMQNDFAAAGGMFERTGMDISVIRELIPPIARVLDASRRHGMKIVYLKMAFRPDLSDLGGPESPNRLQHVAVGVGKEYRAPNGASTRTLIRDTWSTDIIPELEPKAGDAVVYKHRYSGFYQTDLDATLKGAGAKDLIFTGCTTSVCVESTVRDAMFRDYRCLVLRDCTAQPMEPGLPGCYHESTLNVIQTDFGWVSSGPELIRALGG